MLVNIDKRQAREIPRRPNERRIAPSALELMRDVCRRLLSIDCERSGAVRKLKTLAVRVFHAFVCYFSYILFILLSKKHFFFKKTNNFSIRRINLMNCTFLRTTLCFVHFTVKPLNWFTNALKLVNK